MKINRGGTLEFLMAITVITTITLLGVLVIHPAREHTFKVYDANGNTVTCMEIDRGQR